MSIERVTISCLVDAQVNQNVIHFFNPDGAVSNADLAVSIRDVWLANIRPFQRTDTLTYDIEVRTVPGIHVAYHLTVSLLGTGAGSEEKDVPFVCRVFWFQTETAGKKGRGRYYVPGTSCQAWDRGRVKAASITAGLPLIANIVSAYCGGSPTEEVSLVVCPRHDPEAFKPVTSIVQRVNLGVQRRRGLGVGI